MTSDWEIIISTTSVERATATGYLFRITMENMTTPIMSSVDAGDVLKVQQKKRHIHMESLIPVKKRLFIDETEGPLELPEG